MSISGIRGVATKTSFALFFLRDADGSTRRGRRRGRGEPARARVQRQGRGPAVARSAERGCSRRTRDAARGLGGARRRPGAVPQRPLLGAAAAPERRRRRPRHRWASRGRRRLLLDAARVHRRGPARVLLHRRERRAQPAPVHPRARAAAAPTMGRRRRRHAGRGRAPRPRAGARRAAWSRDDRIPAAQAERRDRRPARRSSRRSKVPRARGRLGGRRRLDGAGPARDGRGVPPPAPRGVGAARASRPSGRRADGSIAPRPTSPSSRSSRCTSRPSASSSARSCARRSRRRRTPGSGCRCR